MSCHVDDALYRGTLPQLRRYTDYQRIFLPFRLLIVSQFSIIDRYLRSRTQGLSHSDVILGCFREWDRESVVPDVWTTREKFHRVVNESEGYVNYLKPAPRKARVHYLAKHLNREPETMWAELRECTLAELAHRESEAGIDPEMVLQSHMSITARRSKLSIEGLGAKTLYCGLVQDYSDHGYPISLLPAIWKMH